MQSRYCYPGTTVLINKLDLKDQKALNVAESIYTAKRLLELQESPIKGDFDLKHLKAIHAYIFQDIYDFAGQTRNENIAKDDFRFADARFIEPAADDLFLELKKERHLTTLPFKEFTDRLAYYMAEINVLHAFREGNGRTQREFVRTLALRNGYELDWSIVDKNKVFEASVLSHQNHHSLSQVITESILDKEPNIAIKKSFNKLIERSFDR